MLYNPNWKANPIVSIRGLIAWLETKDPNESYEFWSCDSSCLLSQYLTARGIPRAEHEHLREGWIGLHQRFDAIGITKPWTFGDALKRAQVYAGEI